MGRVCTSDGPTAHDLIAIIIAVAAVVVVEVEIGAADHSGAEEVIIPKQLSA